MAGVLAAFGAFRRKNVSNDGAFGRRTARAVAVGWAFWCVVLFVVAPTWRLATFVNLRGTRVIPRSAPPKESIAEGWLDVCRWARENTSEDAVFLVPRGCDSFKWEAGRAEVGSWKEIPQDARSIVRWFRDMERLYANPGTKKDSPTRWNQPLVVVFINKGRARILKESGEMGYQFAILEAPPYMITAIPEAKKRFDEFVEADEVYRNEQYVVLRLDKTAEMKSPETSGKTENLEKTEKTAKRRGSVEADARGGK